MLYRLLFLCLLLVSTLAAQAQSELADSTRYRYCRVLVDEHAVHPLAEMRISYEKAAHAVPEPEMIDCVRKAHSVPDVLAYLQQHGWALLPSSPSERLLSGETRYQLRRRRD